MNKIIAIVGMCGSGKSVACDLLEKRGYKKVYFGGVTLAKLKEANLEDTPENEKYMREKLRSELGIGAYAIILLPQIEELAKSNNVVLDGLYSWDELKILKEKFNTQLNTIAIIVDRKIRYERLEKRPIRPFSKEKAEKRDISEIENIAKAGPIAYADYYIDNNYTIEDFEKRLDEILKEINREE
ncbi:dephospho-CoA kinase [Mycoplasma sp. CAG:776]|nr:dephospho-CoA kinase [Mycoplasma sp. CAG:776]